MQTRHSFEIQAENPRRWLSSGGARDQKISIKLEMQIKIAREISSSSDEL